MTKHEGSCLCGSVHYAFEGEPLMVGACHCKNCQRQSGAPFSVICGVPEAAYEQTGITKTYQDKGDSGQAVERVFCPECGSPILSRVGAMPGMVFIKAGTLDAPEQFSPSIELYCDRRWPWMPELASQRYPLGLPG